MKRREQTDRNPKVLGVTSDRWRLVGATPTKSPMLHHFAAGGYNEASCGRTPVTMATAHGLTAPVCADCADVANVSGVE